VLPERIARGEPVLLGDEGLRVATARAGRATDARSPLPAGDEPLSLAAKAHRSSSSDVADSTAPGGCTSL